MRIFASCQCADYARVSYVDAVEARVARVMPMFVLSHSLIRMCYVCLVGKAVWCLLRWPTVLSSPTSISIAKECCCPQ